MSHVFLARKLTSKASDATEKAQARREGTPPSGGSVRYFTAVAAVAINSAAASKETWLVLMVR